MPIYEYRCPVCGVFEAVQPMSADDLQECPECGCRIKKLVGRPAVIFNGSGFYSTDYRKTGTSDDEGKDKKDQKKD